MVIQPFPHRELRARRFTDTIMHLLHDFLPGDRYCRQIIYENLFREAMNGNLEIVNVPPEIDALTKLELEQRMLEVYTSRIDPARSEPFVQPRKPPDETR